ncbi:MAG: Coenzyme F420 hydrogenase/dehydrogenase, beta subunit C-terminal domain [Coriobacteriia bacterium]|nr:Coenzyme F420 hydrogenase/dehydrogenase, beta subunit C-terminal domain [Coriobacteriia bacterium]MBN2822705.1 Coenzyme F420 hydrogenase/dehydrogenase, beta subunit C-terminal domain [Coriobacteriia bacterium]
MGLAHLVERLTAKRWTTGLVADYVGEHRGAILAHAADERIRLGAASGGAVTAVLVALLESGRIDGALVCRTVVEGGHVRARYALARTREDLLAAQGSTYVLGDLVRDGLPMIAESRGSYAIVGLPCEIEALRRRPELDERVCLRIALFCGHTSLPALIDKTTEKLSLEAGGAALAGYRFRSGHWRGHLSATFEDGTVIEKPSGYYNMYQNLYFACARKCLACGDHFGYRADLSMGDIWSYRFKDDPIKHTSAIIKTQAGQDAIDAALGLGALAVQSVDITEVMDGQRRVAPFHYNVTARHVAGRRLGVTIPDKTATRVRWHEAWAARIVLRNAVATQTEEGLAAAMSLPRWRLKARLWLLKGLEALS